MKKIAIFVEGQTELEFTKRLLKEISGELNISFLEEAWHAKQFVALRSDKADGKERYFALLVDCQGDSGVKSAILDRRENLIKADYSIILGLRDLYPNKPSDLQKLKQGLAYQLPQANLPTRIVVAVMEIEAWFAQEEFHFVAIDPLLTKDFIFAKHEFNLDTESGETLPRPSKFLDEAYNSAGKRYLKKKSHIARTIGAIDYGNLYLKLRPLLASFDEFAGHLDDFLGD